MAMIRLRLEVIIARITKIIGKKWVWRESEREREREGGGRRLTYGVRSSGGTRPSSSNMLNSSVWKI